MRQRYWFLPKKFWKIFAFYVPSSVEGWMVSALIGIGLGVSYFLISSRVEDGWETVFWFAPVFLLALIILDVLCLKKGEYPSWWKKR